MSSNPTPQLWRWLMLCAGITRIGGFWFGVRRSNFDEVGTIKYIISAPVDDDWDRQGDEFNFEISTDGWDFETIPDDLW